MLLSLLSITKLYCIENKLPSELPLVISVCAYNAAEWVEKNLNSIFSQQYTNFRVIYIDDASQDNTAQAVQDYINRHNVQDKLHLQVNPKRCRKMKNIYNCFHSCKDEEIIVQIDADDWLAHDQVFATINQTYQQNNIWLTYSQYIGFPNNELGVGTPVPPEIIEKNDFRSWKWAYTHLRTFYAWLFKNIKLEDLLSEQTPQYESKFFPLANDWATYFPMLEMCGDKFHFIPEILYIYNWDNPHLGGKLDSKLYYPTGKDILRRPHYTKLISPILTTSEQYINAQADLIIFSTNPTDLAITLKSTENLLGVACITVIYEESILNKSQYQELRSTFPSISFLPANDSYQSLLEKIIKQSATEHIIVAHDSISFDALCNISTYIHYLEKTFAFAVYFGIDRSDVVSQEKEITPHEHIFDDIYAWKLKFGTPTLSGNLDMTLFRKKTFCERLALLPGPIYNFVQFSDEWLLLFKNEHHSIGLFSKKTNINGKKNLAIVPKKKRYFKRK